MTVMVLLTAEVSYDMGLYGGQVGSSGIVMRRRIK